MKIEQANKLINKHTEEKSSFSLLIRTARGQVPLPQESIRKGRPQIEDPKARCGERMAPVTSRSVS